jgi:hypothetical protein
MKRSMNADPQRFGLIKIVSVVVISALVVLVNVAGTWCPYEILDRGKCGTWSLYHPPGYCYVGECGKKQVCGNVLSGNGPLLYCQETSVSCEASLRVYGPDSNGNPCKIYLGIQSQPCEPSITTGIGSSITCP